MSKDRPERIQKKPEWLKKNLPRGGKCSTIGGLIKSNMLHTVCEEALCPNRGECFSSGTATFLIMGSVCTRSCRFCAISGGRPEPLDQQEPSRVAETARQMGLRYLVITSVTRDDIDDGGASLFADTIRRVRTEIPEAKIEVLIPDFQGDEEALITVLSARPDVLNHNVETVSRLYSLVRPEASYSRSLELLKRAKKHAPQTPVKSGIMLGLGETSQEIGQTLQDMVNSGCDILTMGQYLQPSKNNLPVDRFVHPDEFEEWRKKALEMGFSAVVSGPFVRSSYHADKLYYEAARGK